MPDRHEFATLTADDLVTGEAVALDLPPASLGLRILSGVLDYASTMLLFVLTLFVVLVATARTSEALLWAGYIGAVVTALIVYPATLETLTRGRTLGKLAVGLRTVREDAGPISFQHAFVRALVGVVEIYGFTGMPAFLSALVSSRGKRLGDFAAGTYVVRERVQLQLHPPPPMPAHLAAWARSADITSLPTGLALAVRQFLTRLPAIDPVSRDRLGHELATRVSEHVAPQPPPGTHPADFLAAVIASRRERDLVRLRREAALRQRLTSRH